MKNVLLTTLFKNHAVLLRRYITKRLGDSDHAEEIAQEAFQNLLCVENLEQMENPRAYLYTTANNLALNRIRHRRYQQAHLASLPEEEQITPDLERQISAEYDLLRLQKKLNELPVKYRTTFTMSRIDGLSYSEIASIKKISTSTVEKHIIRVLRFLRDELLEEDFS